MREGKNTQEGRNNGSPYVHCQSTHAPASPKYGKSRVPWLSGTASWAHYTATQFILGIRPELDGLCIDPCIPKSWTGFRVKRTFRGHRLEIDVINATGVSKGLQSLTVDGVAIEGNLVPLPLLKDGTKIVAHMG